MRMTMFESQPKMLTAGTVFIAVASFLYWFTKLKRRHAPVQGKVVLITGASSGLGKACAKVFYEAGAKVILSARGAEQLDKVRQELMWRKGKGTFEPKILLLDLENLQSIGQKVDDALSLFGTIDIVINNGGISFRGKIVDTTLDVDMKLMTVNYFAQVALIKALLPHMIEKKSGHIIAVSSVQGKLSIPYRSPYSASKHALQAFCDCLRAEVSAHNIGVSVVSPGYIQTNLSKNALTGDGTTYGELDSTTAAGMLPEYVARQILSAVQYGTKEQVLSTFPHKLAIYTRNILPTLFFSLMDARAKKQAKDYIT